MEKGEDERRDPDWQDLLVAIVAIGALILVGVEAWSVFHRPPAPVVISIKSIKPSKAKFEWIKPGEAAAPADATREPVELAKPAAPASEATPQLSPDEPIHGVVVDPKETPLAGATVQAMDRLGTVAEKTATNAQGEFAFGRLPPNSRHLHVSASGHRATIVVVGDQGRWPQFPSVSNPARIVLEPGVVAVARLQWSDATPCVGVAVHLGAAKRMTTGIDREPRIGPWPPPVTDANGRVEIDGLPPDRVVGLGIDLLGRNEDSPRPFETGHVTAAADAIEQVFTYPKLAKLTVELRGLEEMAEKRLKGTLSIARADGFQSDAQQSVPPFTHAFDPVILGAGYSVHLSVEGREGRELAHRLKIADPDQHVAFDCTLPPIESTPLGRLPWSLFTRVRLLHPDGTPITIGQLDEANLSSDGVRVRYGSLAPEKRDAKARSDAMLQLVNEKGVDGGLSGRLALREAIPLWIEAELGPLRSRVELEKVEENPRVDFLFDLAPLAAGLTRLSFRARDEGGRELTLISVHLQASSSGERSLALPLESGPTWRMVRPGVYHYQCWGSDGGFAEGDVEVPAGSPVTVDVTLPEPGHICGTIAPMPDALRVSVSRTPLDRPRAHHEWWGACFVGPDGNYALDGVPPGDWRLMLTIVATDESTTRVEAATVTVKSDAITRHDFVPMTGATKRFRLDLGAAKRAFLHVTDERGANVVDGAFTPGALVELPTSALHFTATPEIRDEGNNVYWDTDHWTEGTLAAGEGGTTLVRFQFPAR